MGEHAFEPDLVAAILDAEEGSDKEAAYLVYADWLQSQGDRRGELAMLEHQLARKPHHARLHRAKRQFYKEHGARLLPPRVAEMVGQARGQRQSDASGTCEVEWAYGFVHKARIGQSSSSPPCTVAELVVDLLDHPSAQLLHELTIGALGSSRDHDDPPYDYRPVVEALCEAAPASLQTLTLADFDHEHVKITDIDLGDVNCLFASLPRLRHLQLHAGALQLGDIRTPSLRTFRLTTCELGGDLLASLDRAQWPGLVELTLECHDQPLAIESLPALLDATSMPALRRLAFVHTTHTRDIWDALARSAVLGQLDSLDLSWGDLGDHDVVDMTATAPAFAHLGRLVLDANHISRSYRAGARALCAEVSLVDQRGAGADLPSITFDQIIDIAPDARSIMAAGDVADPQRWMQLGSWTTLVWGSYQGTALYDVFVDLASMEPGYVDAGCTCPSSKEPCKHALGLLMLCTRSRLIPVREPPEGFIDGCRTSRYD